MTPFRIVLTTTGSLEQASRIAKALVERRLAACVSIVGPVTSVYRWRGEVTSDRERVLLIKTAADRFEAVRDAIRELHPYELPEIVALAVEDGDAPYLAWLAEALGGPSVSPGPQG